jgi:hypothetical protein
MRTEIQDPTQHPALAWTAADDQLHAPDSDGLDWTETTWWSFGIPERALFGWLYCQVRPNNGTVAGGAFVYDPSGTLPWDIPYFAYAHHTRLPEHLDLRDVIFRNGVSVRCLEPGTRYALGYRFRDQEDFVADLEFRGLTAPVPHVPGGPPFTGSSHYDQMGRVTGSIRLHGESLAVDCISMRDRSWGRRPELHGRRPGDRISYAYGATSERDAFLAFCAPPPEDPLSDVEHLTSGWLLRDGMLRRLVSLRREAERDTSGRVRTVVLTGVDSEDRELTATGTPLAAFVLNAGPICVNSALRWDVAGVEGFGEDQDVWSTTRFRDKLRRAT